MSPIDSSTGNEDSLQESSPPGLEQGLNSPFLFSQSVITESHPIEMTDEELQEMMLNSQPVKYKEKTAELGSLLPNLPTPILKSVTARVEFDIKQLSSDLFEEDVNLDDKTPAFLEEKNAAEIDLNPRLKALKRFSELVKITDNSPQPTSSLRQSLKAISSRVLLDRPVDVMNPTMPPALAPREAIVEYVDPERPAKVKYDQIETPAPELPQPPMPVLKAIIAPSQKVNISGNDTPDAVESAHKPQEITTGISTTKVKYGNFDTPPPDMPQVPMPALKALRSPSSPVIAADEAVIPHPVSHVQAPVHAEAAEPVPTQAPSPEVKASYPAARIPVQPPAAATQTTMISLEYTPPIRSIRNRPSDKIHVTPGRVFNTGTTQPIPLNPRSHPASALTFSESLKTLWKKWVKRLRGMKR